VYFKFTRKTGIYLLIVINALLLIRTISAACHTNRRPRNRRYEKNESSKKYIVCPVDKQQQYNQVVDDKVKSIFENYPKLKRVLLDKQPKIKKNNFSQQSIPKTTLPDLPGSILETSIFL